jgi:hypothetical protein
MHRARRECETSRRRRLFPIRETVGGWGLRAQARRHLHIELPSRRAPPRGAVLDALDALVFALMTCPSSRWGSPIVRFARRCFGVQRWSSPLASTASLGPLKRCGSGSKTSSSATGQMPTMSRPSAVQECFRVGGTHCSDRHTLSLLLSVL